MDLWAEPPPPPPPAWCFVEYPPPDIIPSQFYLISLEKLCLCLDVNLSFCQLDISTFHDEEKDVYDK